MKELGVTFVSIQYSIDTSTATGRFTFNIFKLVDAHRNNKIVLSELSR
jgi:DNA invertase Pin-like site-specific DNA recombinase